MSMHLLWSIHRPTSIGGSRAARRSDLRLLADLLESGPQSLANCSEAVRIDTPPHPPATPLSYEQAGIGKHLRVMRDRRLVPCQRALELARTDLCRDATSDSNRRRTG